MKAEHLFISLMAMWNDPFWDSSNNINADLKQCITEPSFINMPSSGASATFLLACPDSTVAVYLLNAMENVDEDKIVAATSYCKSRADVGIVTGVLDSYSIPVPAAKKSLHVIAAEYRDEIYQETYTGITVGCTREIAEHKAMRIAAEERAAAEAAEKQKRSQRLSRGELDPMEKKIVHSIIEQIQSVWRKPLDHEVDGKDGFTSVRIELRPNGDLRDVQLVHSSNDYYFDNSVLSAVRRAAPFVQVNQLSPSQFEGFRSLQIKFTP